MLKNDEALFLQCFVESDSLQQCLKAVFHRVQAIRRFNEAVVSVYGKNGWEQFQQLGEELSTRPQLTSKIFPTDEAWWNKLEIQTEGNHGVFFNPVTQMTNAILKSSNGWKIDARSMFGRDIDPVQLAKYLESTTGAFEEMALEIRTNKTSINDLGFELYQKVAGKWSAH